MKEGPSLVLTHPLNRHSTERGRGQPEKPTSSTEGPLEEPAGERGAGRGGTLTPAACPSSPQVEGSPSLRWQMALYRGLPGREEDADDPEKIVRRVQEVSAVLYHLEQVAGAGGVSPGSGRSLGLWVGQGAGLGLWTGSQEDAQVSGRGLDGAWSLTGDLEWKLGSGAGPGA